MSAPLSDPLARQHAKLRQDVLDARRLLKPDSLGTVVMAAIEEIEAMKAAGTDPSVWKGALETILRERWPKGRADEWKTLCEECRDYGWRIQTCPGDATCGFHKRHTAHEYATPCWCPKGRAVTPKPKQETDELVNIGKTAKPTRFGR